MAGGLSPGTGTSLPHLPGLDLLLKRYVIQSRSRVPLETPQEMFLGIALHLAMNEGSDRMGWVKRFYDMLSRMEVTMATPTMSNARKPCYHQLSSCFVDTVPDSLDGIYRSLDNFAKVSFGGGMGMYFGKVRAAGSTIRGFQGRRAVLSAGSGWSTTPPWRWISWGCRAGRCGGLLRRMAPGSAGIPSTAHQQRRRPHEGA